MVNRLVYRRVEVTKMAKSKKRAPSPGRNQDILGMILGRKAKSWDARERRSKDARRKREEFATHEEA